MFRNTRWKLLAFVVAFAFSFYYMAMPEMVRAADGGNGGGGITQELNDVNLQVKIDSQKNTYYCNEYFSFTVETKNSGPDVANDVEVSVKVPSGLILVSGTTTQGTFNPATGIWKVGTLNPQDPDREVLTVKAISSFVGKAEVCVGVHSESVCDHGIGDNRFERKEFIFCDDKPTVGDYNVTTPEDTPVSGQVVGHDYNDPLVYCLDTAPTHGKVVVNSDGTWTYTPDKNYNGPDAFKVLVKEKIFPTCLPVPEPCGVISTVHITVTPVNDPPEAPDYSYSTPEDTPVGDTVEGTDIDGDELSYIVTTQPQYGIVTMATSTGVWEYTPNKDFNGQDSFIVTVDDGNGGTDTSTITINVTPLNDSPTVPDYHVTTSEDTPVDGKVIGVDPDNELTYSQNSAPSHGTVVVNSDGTWSYTPNPNYNGDDSFTVAVTEVLEGPWEGGPVPETVISTIYIEVKPVNDPPTVGNYQVETPEDTPVGGTVVGTDIEEDPLTYSVKDNPQHGTVSVQANGQWNYAPAKDYNGNDQFTVWVDDGHGGKAISTVSIVVTPVNDLPVVPDYNVTTPEDTPLPGAIVGTDVDNDPLTYSVKDAPQHGTAALQPSGEYVYTPAKDYNGNDLFTVWVDDGQGGKVISTVNIVVTPVNDAPAVPDYNVTTPEDTPVSGTIQASDAEQDSLSYAKKNGPQHGTVMVLPNGQWTYTPTLNYNGNDQFTVEVSDGNDHKVISTVNIIVTPLNDPPTVKDYNATTPEETPVSGQVKGTDVDNDPLTYSLKAGPSHGTVTVQAGGEWTYTPAVNYNGSDSFTVNVDDGKGGKAVSTVTITVTPVNDIPTVPNYTAETNKNTPVSGKIVGQDIDGDTLSYKLQNNGTHGKIKVEATGEWTYTPDKDYSGEDQFTVLVDDGNGGKAVSTVKITVKPVSDGNLIQTGSPIDFTVMIMLGILLISIGAGVVLFSGRRHVKQ